MAPRGCAAHCRACGSCFATDSAFDAHRIGRHELPTDHPEGRHCADPDLDDRFEALEGICSISTDRTRRGVVVYRLNGAKAQEARERIKALRGR